MYPKTIIATADDCLSECEFNFVIHEKTGIRTSLGNIMIIEVVTEGLALVAGPSTNQDMIKIIRRLKKYNVKKIFIDGALFRKSIASFRVADACILATGASYSDDMDRVVRDTAIMIEQLNLKHVSQKEEMKLISFDSHLTIDKGGHVHPFPEKSLLHKEHVIANYLNENVKCLYINGALTNKMIDIMIDRRHYYHDIDIVVRDATHILAAPSKVKDLQNTSATLKVLNKLNLLFLTYNPVSPNGTVFDNETFRARLQEQIDLDIFNVVTDSE